MARHELAPTATAAVVFLHGSGDTGAGAQAWAAHVWEGPHGDFETTLGLTANAKVVFPTAAARPYSLMGGAPSTVWFDRGSLQWEAAEDVDGIMKSYQASCHAQSIRYSCLFDFHMTRTWHHGMAPLPGHRRRGERTH